MAIQSELLKHIEDHLSYFTWLKADKGYYWDDGAQLIKELKDVNKTEFGDIAFIPKVKTEDGLDKQKASPPYLIKKPETTGFHRNKVLEQHTKLFIEFSEIELSQEGILRFADKYGMLTHGEALFTPKYSHKEGEGEPWKHGVGALLHQKKGLIYAGVYGESFSFWKREIEHIKQTIQFWEWYKGENVAALRKVVYWTDDWKAVKYTWGDKDTLSNYTKAKDYIKDYEAKDIKFQSSSNDIASNEISPKIFSTFMHGDLLLPAQYLVQSRINNKLNKHITKTKLLWNNKNKLVLYLMPETLLGAIWFQFARAAAGEREYRRCSICDQLADVTDNQRNWSKHPDCANRDRVRRARGNGKNGQKKGRTSQRPANKG